ncbi:MAG: hypothetical protein GY778_17225 [bacterium]|nr:hypothetical protein [bacterium]
MHRKTHLWALAFVGILSAPDATVAAWIVVEIPNLPGWAGDTEATGVNDNGQVCGMGNYVVNTSSTPFRYDGTTVTELPLLPGANLPIALTTGINSSGVVCGYSRNAAGDSQACYWVGTTVNTIPYPPDANLNSDLRAYGINDDGVIVGYCWNGAGQRTAFYYKDGTSYSVDAAIVAGGLTGGKQRASAVNNQGLICGTADDASGGGHAWTYDIDTGVFTDLGQIGIADCSGSHINASGQVIGRGKYYPFDVYYRVVIHDGAWRFVGPDPTESQWPQGIGDTGRVIGQSYFGSSVYLSWYSSAPDHADLNWFDLPGWDTVQARGINGRDWVVGYGAVSTAGGYDRGFIIKPPPGDADHDGDLDLADGAELQFCFAPTGPVPPGCETFDSEPDGDVDLVDLAAFVGALEGP